MLGREILEMIVYSQFWWNLTFGANSIVFVVDVLLDLLLFVNYVSDYNGGIILRFENPL